MNHALANSMDPNDSTAPPPGMGSNGTDASNPPSRIAMTSYGASGPEVLAVVWAMTFVATCFLAVRLWVKHRSHKGLWWDDHMLLASWTMLVCFAAAATYCVHAGIGTHVGQLGGTDQESMQLGIIIATVFSVLGAAWSKTSFALTLLRITREGEHRYLYWGIWAVVVTMNVVLVFNAIIQFIWCVPAAAAWSPLLHGKCWNRDVVIKYTQFGAAYSAAMDFALASVPWKVVMQLRMRLKEKLGVVICMSLGFFAGVTSIMRAVTVPALYAKDYSYAGGLLLIWTGAELATTIVAASIPILRVLLHDMVHSKYRRGATELNTFKSARDGEGIRVTRTTVITRSPSEAERGVKSKEDSDSMLTLSTPETPVPTYHSYITNK